MKKNQVILLVLCILCFIANIIYILLLSDNGKILGLIQYLAIYMPFFALLFIKNKKYAMYITLAFCGFELLVNLFDYIRSIVFLLQPDVSNKLSVIVYIIEKMFSNVIKVLLIINVFKWLQERERSNTTLISIMLILLVVGGAAIIGQNYFSLRDNNTTINTIYLANIASICKDIVLNFLLVFFVMTNFIKPEISDTSNIE